MAKEKQGKTVHLIAGTVFIIVTFIHALRIANGWPLVMGNLALPMWLSWIAVFITGSLGVLLWKTA